CFGYGACTGDGEPSGGPEPQTVTEVRGACTPGLAPPASGYVSITEIPSLGGNKVFVEDINDDGVAVGAETTAAGIYHAFRYTEAGGVQDLGALAGCGGAAALAARAGSGVQSCASAAARSEATPGHSDRADGTGVLFGYGYTAT